MTDATANLLAAVQRVLTAACIGDALGAPTEAMHPEQIAEVFGRRIESFVPAPPGAPFAEGSRPGAITDDASQMLAMVDVLVATAGKPDLPDVARGLGAWFGDQRGYGRLAGPSTRAAIERLRAGEDPARVATPERYSVSVGTTNGAAMRAPAAGCARAGDLVGAAELATILAAPTHNTQIAFAGAAALAAAIAAGLGQVLGTSQPTLADAALLGAQHGMAMAKQRGRLAPGPSVDARLRLAIRIGSAHRGDPFAAIAELGGVVGAGLAMTEAVPCAIGLAIAAEDDAWSAIVAAANWGDDSDTVALFAGAVTAAWSPNLNVPDGLLAELEDVNGLDLKATARNLVLACSPDQLQ